MRRRSLVALLLVTALELVAFLTLSCQVCISVQDAVVDASSLWPASSPYAPYAACCAAGREAARNVILFIGDGMGPGQLAAGQLAKGGPLVMESMPVRATVTTTSSDGNITDSAAAATALATGHKTVNGALAVLPDGTPVRTILEAARDAGWLVGVVTTCSVTDATPAAFATHAESRRETRAIAEAIIGAKVDLIMGGGAADFLPTLFVKGKAPIDLARESGYTVAQDRKGFDEASSLPFLGLFAMTDLDYERDRDPGRQPSLAEMTEKAMRLLSCTGKRFLLVVEGGLVDHACHDNDIEALLGEMGALDDAIARCLAFTRERKDTLVVVTADHETGRLSVGAGKGTGAGQDLTFGMDGHTDIEVPLFAEGPGQELFAGHLDNTDVPKVIAEASGLEMVGGSAAQGAQAEADAETKAAPAVGGNALATEERAVKPQSLAPAVRLTVMTFNIHSGVGADLNLDLDRIADLIRNERADIVGLCEVDQGTRRSLQVDQVRYIAEKLGYHYAYGPNFWYDGGAFGNAVLSRYPIVSSVNHPLPNTHSNEPRGVLEAQIDVGDGAVLNVFVTHLDVEYADSRLAQARAVAEISSTTAGPKIVMGDLNAPPTGSPEVATLLRYFNDTQQAYRVLVDSAELVKEGLFSRDYLKGGYTYDAYDPARRIDYILTSFDIKIAAEPGAARVPHTLASDHLPYVAAIELPWPAARKPGATAAAGSEGGFASDAPLVVILTTEANEAWYEDMRWDYEDDTSTLVEFVKSLGLDLVEVSEGDLGRLPFIAATRPTVLVLSNLRRISPEQAQAVRDFVAGGGRLLATGQTSLKTEDERPGGFHGFQLADLLGVAFVGWQGVAPLHGAIVSRAADAGGTPEPDGEGAVLSSRASGVSGASDERAEDPGPRAALYALWSGVETPLRLPASQGVIARCLPGGIELGVWTDTDGSPAHPDPFNVAVAAKGAALYIGADILSRNALSDPAVRSFARNALRYLVQLDPQRAPGQCEPTADTAADRPVDAAADVGAGGGR
ncbi:MAG: alkaline phosphatase [Betaproteobacteria bacterium]